MTQLPILFERAVRGFGDHVARIGDGDWTNATPCSEWDVRMLVNHLVYEARWAPPLLDGATLAEVGDRFEGDLLGDDPKQAYAEAAAAVIAAAKAPGALERVVHLSYGDVPGSEYLGQMTADFTVHSWDLARGLGADDRLDPELIRTVQDMVEPQQDALAASGLFDPPVAVPDDADEQTRLLAMFGRRR